MTAPANKTPLSVDYTGRDYYALRTQLIERVKERTNNNWQGNDPSDFGLALIESFAYMGDLINYYIDRIANESYIMTATQRESLLNLAKMYGYNPANYVSSIVDLQFSNSNGYSGAIGAAIIEDGIINGTLYTNLAKIIVPNDNTFVVDNVINVAGIPTIVNATIAGTPVTYDASVYNGQFAVKYVGYNNIGRNVIWYQPLATISAITTSGTKFTVTSTGSLNPVSGQKVTIKNVVVSGSSNNYNGKWVIASTTTAQAGIPATFTVESANNNAAITALNSNGTTVTFSAWSDFVAGQVVDITGINNENAGVGYNFTGATIASVRDDVAVVSNAAYGPSIGAYTYAEFTTSKLYAVNDIVNVVNITSAANPTGALNSGFNFTDADVASVTTTNVTINGVVGTGSTGTVTYTTSTDHGLTSGQYVTITGVNSTKDGSSTSVYNIAEARIISTPTTTTFTVNAYFTDTYVNGGNAALYKFRITTNRYPSAGDSYPNGGAVLCKQFKVTNSYNTAVASETGTAVAKIGGTYTSGGAVYYSELPAILGGGGAAIGQIRSNGSDTVPAGTQVSASVTDAGVTSTLVFTTQSDAVVPWKGSVSPILAIQGEDVSLRAENAANIAAVSYDINGEKIGISDGSADQSFILKEIKVNPTSVNVYVDNGTAFEQWTLVQNIRDYSAGDKVFNVTINSANQVLVNFGDGISGAIPTSESTIKAVYIAGGGVIGNVGVGTITSLGSIPGLNSNDEANLRSAIKVTNIMAASGGGDPETNDSIRYNTPRALRSLNRAVTLEDFANLALTVPGVAKANATATNRSNVTVYVAPLQSGLSDITPGILGSGTDTVTNTTQLEYLLNTSVPDFLDNKKSIGTTVTYSPPTYTDIFVGVTYAALPQYSGAVVESNIKTAITSDFSFSNVQFEDVITPEEVEFKLRQVDGVRNVKVTSLYRYGGAGRNSLIGTANEIFIFQESGITLSQASSVSTLSGITVVAKNTGGSTVTPVIWSKTFNAGVYNYQVTVPSTSTSLIVTPFSTDTTASITVNNTAVSSGSSFTSVGYVSNSLNVFDPIVINVTATDGVTVTSYAVSVIVAA